MFKCRNAKWWGLHRLGTIVRILLHSLHFTAMSGLRSRRGQQEAPESDLFFGRPPLVQGSPSTFDDKSTPGRSVYGAGLHSGYVRSSAAGLTPGMPTPRSTSKPPTRYDHTSIPRLSVADLLLL